MNRVTTKATSSEWATRLGTRLEDIKRANRILAKLDDIEREHARREITRRFLTALPGIR